MSSLLAKMKNLSIRSIENDEIISNEEKKTSKTTTSVEMTTISDINVPQKTAITEKFDTSVDSTKKLLEENQDDFCDCNDKTCPGCFFPCGSCKSNKCGHICRVSRKWKHYDAWVLQGEHDEDEDEDSKDFVLEKFNDLHIHDI